MTTKNNTMAEGRQDNCEGVGPHTAGEVRLLPVGSDDNAVLCRSCYTREMIFRRQRNEDLPADSQFALPYWNELKIYRE